MMNACNSYIRVRNFSGLKRSGSTKIEFLFATLAQLKPPGHQGRRSAEARLGGGQEHGLLIPTRDLECKTLAVFLILAGTS